MQKKAYVPLLEIEKVLPILNKISIFDGLNDMQLYQVFRLRETSDPKFL